MIYFHLKNDDDVKQESGWDCCKRWKDDQLNISGKLSPFSRWKMEKLPRQPWRRFFQLFLQFHLGFIVAAKYSKANIKLYLGSNLKNLWNMRSWTNLIFDLCTSRLSWNEWKGLKLNCLRSRWSMMLIMMTTMMMMLMMLMAKGDLILILIFKSPILKMVPGCFAPWWVGFGGGGDVRASDRVGRIVLVAWESQSTFNRNDPGWLRQSLCLLSAI